MLMNGLVLNASAALIGWSLHLCAPEDFAVQEEMHRKNKDVRLSLSRDGNGVFQPACALYAHLPQHCSTGDDQVEVTAVES